MVVLFVLTIRAAFGQNLQQYSSNALSQARIRPVGISAGSKLLFGGGGSTVNLAPSAVVDIFDANAKTWSVPASLSVPRIWFCGTSVGPLAFFAVRALFSFFCVTRSLFFQGGYDQTTSTTYATVDIYNSSSGRWNVSSLGQPRHDLACTSIPSHGIALFAGGQVGVSAPEYARVDIYNVATGRWSISALSLGRQGVFATSVKSRAFFAVCPTFPFPFFS